jgi:hypothetical protein
MLLHIPDGASVISQCEEDGPVRHATLYSLVVNERADTYAEALAMWEFGTQSGMKKERCAIEIVEDEGRSTHNAHDTTTRAS